MIIDTTISNDILRGAINREKLRFLQKLISETLKARVFMKEETMTQMFMFEFWAYRKERRDKVLDWRH